MRASVPILYLLVGSVLGCSVSTHATSSLDGIRLPPGFEIRLVSDQVPNARSMALGERGTLFVGTRKDGRVYALSLDSRTGSAQRVFTLAQGLDMPNGIAFRDGALYVAESGRVLRFDGIESRLADPPRPVTLTRLPRYSHHGWRYLGFGPDGLLYVSLGAPCNVCDTAELGVILRMRSDGSGKEVYAHGVRNSVGFDWHPATGELWFTDNGRDWLGDDLPPDELNHAPRPGLHFGFPYCHGVGIRDPEYAVGKECGEFTSPVQELGPHVASLGMRFYDGSQFPVSYRNQVLIAEHGSWNRSEPIGYRISLVRLEDRVPVSYEAFAEGWLGEDGQVTGRPVDLLVLPDGSLLVSDDKTGAVYRIVYTGSLESRP